MLQGHCVVSADNSNDSANENTGCVAGYNVCYIHTYVCTYVRTYICMYICSLIIEKKKSELRDTQRALVRHSTSFYMNMGSLNKLPQRAVYPV